MSQRDSGYQRITLDNYSTPPWVTRVAVRYIGMPCFAWEPATGEGKMVSVLLESVDHVHATCISSGTDFLKTEYLPAMRGLGSGPTLPNLIITNPPYEYATQFIEHALHMMKPVKGAVMMLLRTDFDHAVTRQHLFGRCAQFALKIVLTKRIQWFEHSTASPSFNHAWFKWSWTHRGLPKLVYEPKEVVLKLRKES